MNKPSRPSKTTNIAQSKPFIIEGLVSESKRKEFPSSYQLHKKNPIVDCKNLSIDLGEKTWYDELSDLLPVAVGKHEQKEITSVEVLAAIQGAYRDTVENHNKANIGLGKSDEKWMKDVIRSGTVSDKIAALALKVQESPFHNLDAIEMLTAMVAKNEQRTAQLALDAMKDLLINNLLPNRKLVALNCRIHALSDPEIAATVKDSNIMKVALLMYFEDELKKAVDIVVAAVDSGTKSMVEFFKRSCMSVAVDMIKSKPEQESRLLTLIVGRLSDSSSVISSKCMELLKGLLQSHPAMKLVVIKEVRQLIYKSQTKLRTIFNSVVFLSSITLVSWDNEVSVQLVDCYMSLFEKALQDGEGSRLLGALLNGVNKALPLLRTVEPLIKHISALFRMVHTSSFAASTQALALLAFLAIDSNANIGSEGHSSIKRRYYRALYTKLLSDDVLTHGKNTLFLNLLYRSVKKDDNENRAMAFIKRLSICASWSAPPIAAGLLFLISGLLLARPSLRSMIQQESEPSAEDVALRKGETMEDANDNDNDNGSVMSMNTAFTGSCLLGPFDAAKREPDFAATSIPSLWEMSLLKHHFHPSVRTFTQSLLTPPRHEIIFDGDPIASFSIMSFLNRFAYKNPKKPKEGERRVRRQVSENDEEPINLEVARLVVSGDSKTATDAATVAPDKAFFVKFFADRSQLEDSGKSRPRSRKEALRKLKDGQDDEDSEAAIDDFADQLAETMLKENDADVDVDDDDYGDEHDSIGGEEPTGQDNSKKRVRSKTSAAMDFEDFIMEDQDNDGSELDLDNFSGEEDEDDEDDDGEICELQAYEGESDGSEDNETLPKGKSQKKGGKNDKRGKKHRDDDFDDNGADFASADDYQEQMDAIIQEIQQLEGKDSADSKGRAAKPSNKDSSRHERSGNSKIGEKVSRDQRPDRKGKKKQKTG
eukprot:gene27227-35958_t